MSNASDPEVEGADGGAAAVASSATPPPIVHRRQLGGSLQPLMGSMLMSLVLAFLSDLPDYCSIVCTSHALQAAATRFFVHPTIRFSSFTTRRSRRTASLLQSRLMAHRPFTLLVDDVETFFSRLTVVQQWREDPSLLRVGLYSRFVSRWLPQGDYWGFVFNVGVPNAEPVAPRRHDTEEASATSGSTQPPPPPRSVTEPAHLWVANGVYRSGYDSEGYTESPRYAAQHLPFRPEWAFLFTTLRTLTISQFDGALSSLLRLWSSGLDSEERLPDTAGIMQLEALYLLSCGVEEAELVCALAMRASPRKVVVDTPFRASGRGVPSVGADTSAATSRVRSVALKRMDTASRIPATAGLQCLRVGSLHVLEPAAWATLTCPHLVSLHIDAADCDPHRASLDLDVSAWSHLRDVYLGRCASVTALVGGPSLVSLHLHACTIHFRGVVAAEAATVLLVECVGASTFIGFRCLSLTLERCTGRPMVREAPAS